MFSDSKQFTECFITENMIIISLIEFESKCFDFIRRKKKIRHWDKNKYREELS